MANSRRIKNATEQYQSGLISIWRFLLHCSYTSAAYKERQRNWALRTNEDDAELDHQDEADAIPALNNNPYVDNNNAPDLSAVQNPPNVEQLPVNGNICMTCMVAK